MKYRLQQYEDGTVGYLGIDGDEKYNFTTKSRVICTQEEYEDREDFITENGITIKYDRYGYDEYLDKQVNDESDQVRAHVAEMSYGLDKLFNDESSLVREKVASLGYYLDILINDEEEYVRMGVIKGAIKEKRNDLLDTLINDENVYVRMEVAKYGYGLNKFINDIEYWVREIVAKQGYGLDKLVDDNNMWVNAEVARYLKEHDLTLAQWKEQYPEKCVIKN